MSEYYAVVREGQDDHLEHLFGFGSRKGSQKANHKYVARVQVGNGWKYFYSTAELAAYKAGGAAKGAARAVGNAGDLAKRAAKAAGGAAKGAAKGAANTTINTINAAGSAVGGAASKVLARAKKANPIKITTGEEARKAIEKRRKEREKMFKSSNYKTTTKKFGPLTIRVARKKRG